MKLGLMSLVFAVASVALACGCSEGSPKASRTPVAFVADTTATTRLMSAELPAPTPKVGKAHLAVDDDADTTGSDSSTSTSTTTTGDELGMPKEARRSDGSRRGGHFGTSK